MSEFKLWILVSEDGLHSHQSIDEAVSSFDNLATFVVNKSKIVCLTYNPDENEAWQLDAVGLEVIAKAILERMEK